MITTAENQPQLTDAEKSEYRERGYWVSPKLLDDEQIATLRHAIERIMNGERDRQTHGWQGVKEFDLQGKAVCQYTNAWWINEEIERALHHPAIGGIGAQLMNTPEVRVWHDQVIWKPGVGANGEDNSDGNVGWHQDYGHWQCANTDNFCTAWIALQDTDLTNGGMRTIVGSHKWGLTEDSYTFGEKDLDGLRKKFEKADQPWIDEPCVLKAGQASFHHALTFHGSGPNLSDEPRLCLIVHMMPKGCGLRKDAPRWHLCGTLLGPHARADQPYEGPFFPQIWPPKENG